MKRARTLRTRLVVLSAGVSAAVLVAVLVVLYLAVSLQLRSAVGDALAVRVDDLAADVATGSTVVDADPFAQVLGADGSVLGRSAAAPSSPLLSPAELSTARAAPLVAQRDVPGLGDPALLRARSAGIDGAVVVAGASLEEVEAARTAALTVLLVALPVLVAALVLGTRRVVGAAMRPVRELTREADAISVTDLDRRLTVPPGDDEIADLAKTLDAMLARLATSVRRERAFIDDASHELRTPLAVLLGELELAASSEDPAEVRRGLAIAHAEARRLAALAQDLLVLAREGAGGAPLRRRPLDLLAVASDAAHRLRPVVGLPIAVDGAPVVVDGDPLRLSGVVVNLVTNAANAGARHVAVRVRRDADTASLEVGDDGPGFPDGLLEGAFERFRRGDAARTRADDHGSGLGLAIVAATAVSHRGRVSAGTDPELGGALVSFRLPVSAASGEAPPAG